MGTLKEKLRHAFHVDPPGPAEPTPQQQPAVDWFCQQIARRQLTTPGLIALEMGRPLNFIASQAMHFLSPGVWAVAPNRMYEGYKHFAEFLEHRGAMEYLEQRIEHFEAEYERRERERRDQRKAAKTGPEDKGDA
ncbi:MAG: hypothetical protein GY715_18945 [Planctomycetes bacterium]|nr:hypothetical protein [Planctomycetota bacterium]